MSKQNESKPNVTLNVNLRVFVYIGLIFLLFYPPFLRGLFFPPELLMTHMFTAVLFALCWYDKLLKREVSFLSDPLDYSMLAFVLVYGISLIGAVNMRGAVGELLKVINYFMVYWISAQTVKSERDIKNLYRAIYLSAVGVAAIGLGAGTGLVEYPGAIEGSRIYSTLQYPNTTAAFLSLATFLGFALLNTSLTRVGKMIYSSGNMLLVTVIVMAQSRGSWFMYPFILTLFFIGMPRRYRFPTLYNLAVAVGVGLQAARVLQPRIQSGAGALKYIILGAAVAVIAQWLYDFVTGWLDRREVPLKTRRLLGAGVIAYAVVVFIVYITYTAQAVPTVSSHFAPAEAVKRAGTMTSQETSAVARIDLTKAAFRMSLDYPVNGLGGEGWNALYHRYMPYLMFSSETHNYPAKVLVETGFTGLFVLFSVWFFWARNLFRLWKAGLAEESWFLVWTGGAAAAALVIHSLYDFDLSMGAMGIVLWGLWGIPRGAENALSSNKMAAPATWKKLTALCLAGAVGAAALFVPAACLYAAGMAGAEGARQMTKQNWVQAEEKLLKAVRLDPFTASYAADLAHVYTIKGMAGNDPSQIELSDSYANRAVRWDPYNYKVRLRLMMISLLSGRVERAVGDAESLLAHNPLDVHNFEILGKVYITAGRYLYESGSKDKARQYWQKTGELQKQLEQKIRELDKDHVMWKGEPLQVTPVVNLYLGEAAYLLGDYHKALELLEEASSDKKGLPEPLRVEARLYLAALKAKEGRAGEAEHEIGQLAKSFPGVAEEFRRILKITP